jgi:hypothetical protein
VYQGEYCVECSSVDWGARAHAGGIVSTVYCVLSNVLPVLHRGVDCISMIEAGPRGDYCASSVVACGTSQHAVHPSMRYITACGTSQHAVHHSMQYISMQYTNMQYRLHVECSSSSSS